MIRLITGTPGSGKTLYTVAQIMQIREKAPERQIFTDIKGLRIDGVQEAPDDWRDTPDGSLIIYDEVQYRQQYTKKRGRNLNSMIVDLTTHRHTGKDIWLITQNPKFLHADVLAVVGEHYHIDRPMNAAFANVYKWRTAQENPNGVTVRRRAENAPIFKYDKDLFQYYDSVDVDEENANHKGLKIPILKVLPLAIGLLICLWAFYAIVFDGGVKPPTNDKTEPTKAQSTTPQESAVDTVINGNTAPQIELTEEQLKEQLKLQQEQFILEIERQRTQMILEYQDLKMQLMERDKQIKDFQSKIELFSTTLPKDYQIIEQNPALQVRSVVKFGNKCKAYNAQGSLMTLDQDQCNYYLQESGRVWKSDQAQITNSSPTTKPEPLPAMEHSTTAQMPSNSQSQVNALPEYSGNLDKQ